MNAYKKKSWLIALLLIIVSSAYAQRVLTAEEVLTPAYAQAKKEKKNVLLMYHASWCGWCRKMDSSLLSKDVRPLIDKFYVTAHLTVHESETKKGLENPGAQALYDKHGGEALKSLPYWLILDEDGNVLANSQYQPGKNTGCPATEAEVAYFISVLRKTSSLTDQQLGVVEKRFRQNEYKGR